VSGGHRPGAAVARAAGPRDGQVALVTGGSAGLGLAIATALARAGSGVVLASRSAARCEDAAARLSAETGRFPAAPAGGSAVISPAAGWSGELTGLVRGANRAGPGAE
jgi:NAD(P)-dependent dehydrogenase (short-subunit alcohol dehydrogenase family)